MTKEKILGESTVSSQWQTTLIREVRPLLEIKKGDRIEFVWKNGEVLLRRAPAQNVDVPLDAPLVSLNGRLGYIVKQPDGSYALVNQGKILWGNLKQWEIEAAKRR